MKGIMMILMIALGCELFQIDMFVESRPETEQCGTLYHIVIVIAKCTILFYSMEIHR